MWSLVAADGFLLRIFFLRCIVIAGLYGAATAAKSILFVQAIPAILALVVTFLAYR